MRGLLLLGLRLFQDVLTDRGSHCPNIGTWLRYLEVGMKSTAVGVAVDRVRCLKNKWLMFKRNRLSARNWETRKLGLLNKKENNFHSQEFLCVRKLAGNQNT